MARGYGLTRRTAGEGGDLHDVARLHQIDRELVTLRVGLLGLKWVVFPGLGVAAALILRRLLEVGPASTSAWLTGLVGAVTGGAVLVHAYRERRETVDDLRHERAVLSEKLNSREADPVVVRHSGH